MEREVDLLRRVVAFLEEHGYPTESFVVDWPVGDRLRVDLAVVDPETAEPIALFELKREKNDRSLRMAERQLRAYWDALGKRDIPVFAVTPSPDRGFELHRFSPLDSDAGSQTLWQVPDFSLLRTTRRQKAKAEVVTSGKKQVDRMAAVCWTAGIVVGLLTTLDFLGIVSVTPERLGLIALVAGLLIVPYASKLKLLGIEFERLRHNVGE